MSIRIGVLPGSFRPGGNSVGISAFVSALLSSLAPKGTEVVILDSTNTPLPLGPVLDETIAAMVPLEGGKYASPKTQEWSDIVKSLSALVVVTPQHNWSIPGELKNSFDHLYHEWNGLPSSIVTLGGHGGGKCAAHLREVMGSALHMKVLEKGVEIHLPREYVRESERVGGQDVPEWLQAYRPQLEECLKELLVGARAPKI